MNSNLLQNNQRHPYHLVDPSPWPLSGALGGFALTFGGVMFMHGYSGGWSLFCLGFLTILYTMYVWWRDIVREGTFEGQHTYMVQQGLRQGVLLFIVSEATCRTSSSNMSPVFLTFECLILFMKLRPVYP